MRYRAAFGEFDQPSRARDIRREVGDIEAAGVKMIAGEKNARRAIIVGYMRGVMAGNRDHVDHAIAKIDAAGLLRPLLDSEGLLFGGYFGRNQRDAGHPREPLVARDVIAMPVRMDHQQRSTRRYP